MTLFLIVISIGLALLLLSNARVLARLLDRHAQALWLLANLETVDTTTWPDLPRKEREFWLRKAARSVDDRR